MLIIILGLPMLAQDISFPSAIVSAGGGTGDGNPVNFSRWRIGQVHVLTIPTDQSAIDADLDWNVSAYPNPVKDFLLLEFELPETGETIWARGEAMRDSYSQFFHGTGLKFTGMARAHQRLIRDFVCDKREHQLLGLLKLIRRNRRH